VPPRRRHAHEFAVPSRVMTRLTRPPGVVESSTRPHASQRRFRLFAMTASLSAAFRRAHTTGLGGIGATPGAWPGAARAR